MRLGCKFGLGITLLLAATASRAQMAPDNVGSSANGMPTILQGVGFRPELNAQMPLDTPFKDEAGKDVRLGEYFHQQKPVVVAFVYYGCPMMCTQLEQGVVGALRMLSFNPARDYEVVFISFDERDTAQMAAEKKAPRCRSSAALKPLPAGISSLVRNNPSPLPRMRQISISV